MKTLALATLLLLLPSVCVAQSNGSILDNSIVLSGAPNYWDQCFLMPAFVPTPMYVIAGPSAGGILGYEASVDLPAELILLSTVFVSPGVINVGSPTNFIIGAGACFDAASPVTLVTYTAGFFSGSLPLDVVFCLGPSEPSSFVPAQPGYLACDGSLFPYGYNPQLTPYPPHCGVINPQSICEVASTSTSWGAVKAAY